jgi:arginine decarboxylase-like protein
VKMFSGLIVVTSAVYGIIVSLLLCLAAVIIFTGHALLFLILFMTILGESVDSFYNCFFFSIGTYSYNTRFQATDAMFDMCVKHCV